MYANVCSFTGRLAKTAKVGQTSQGVPITTAILIVGKVSVYVLAYGPQALILGQVREGQFVAVIGPITANNRQFCEIKAESVALVPNVAEPSEVKGVRQ